MPDTTFRTKAETTAPEVSPKGKTPAVIDTTEEAVPYLGYEKEHNHPFTVDHFKLGDTWEDPTGGFPKEISLIEEYLQKKIQTGELADNVEAIKRKLKEIEKVTGVKDETRSIIRIETIAAYVKFLMESDKIKFNIQRYGSH